MRRIGHITGPQDARRFLDFLATDGIAAVADPEPGGFSIWVKDENRVQTAVDELARFQENPLDPRYAQAQQKAEVVRKQEQQRREGTGNVVQMRERWRGQKTGQRPLTIVLVALSALVSVFSDFGQFSPNAVHDTLSEKVFDQLVFCTREDFRDSGHDPLASVKRGQVWRLITPIFLHGSPMHLVFNMIMLYQLGGLYEWRRGTVRYGALILGLALFSCLTQALIPPEYGGSPFFVGMSGVVYGIFGYFWMRGLVDPQADVRLSTSTEVIMLLWLVAGFAGLLGNLHVANWAHGGGLLAGVIAAIVPLLLREGMKK